MDKGNPLRSETAAERSTGGKIDKVHTPLEFRFADPAGYDDFAAGKLPVTLILKSAASGRAVRFDPLPLHGFRPDPARSTVTFHVLIEKVAQPVWNENGCVETRPAAQAWGDGVAITLTYAACPSGTAARSATPIPEVGVIVRKNPPRELAVVVGQSQVGKADELGDKLATDRRSGLVIVRSEGF